MVRLLPICWLFQAGFAPEIIAVFFIIAELFTIALLVTIRVTQGNPRFNTIAGTGSYD